MLTIQILTRNNQQTIEKCLESILPLKATILIADLGSTDDTCQICQNLGLKVQKFDSLNHSKVRNQLLTKNWQMYLEPYEYLTTGHDEIKEIVKSKSPQAYYFNIVQGTVINKEIRLWNNNLTFKNPIFEMVEDNLALDTNSFLYSKQYKIDCNYRFKLIENWKKECPTCNDVFYYQALTLLLQGKYAEFSGIANHYLFLEKNGKASTMLRYYLAMAQAYGLNEINESIRNTLMCIAVKPLMAEFWCLLGDIHFKFGEPLKAMEFYENAIILGGKRLNSDNWPIDVSKYKEHPENMLKILKENYG